MLQRGGGGSVDLSAALLRPLLKTAARWDCLRPGNFIAQRSQACYSSRAASGQKAKILYTLAHVILSVFSERLELPAVTAATTDCLAYTLRLLAAGALLVLVILICVCFLENSTSLAGPPKAVAEAFLPLKLCIEILGSNMRPRAIKQILAHCLKGLANKVCTLIYLSFIAATE